MSCTTGWQAGVATSLAICFFGRLDRLAVGVSFTRSTLRTAIVFRKARPETSSAVDFP
jgi:hypothetical protein